MMKIIIGGALGRMGQQVAAAAQNIVCGVDIAYNGQDSCFPVFKNYADVNLKADVLIDFSHASALPALLEFALKQEMPAVLCTTGYTDEDLQQIEKTSRYIPILRSANMSLGVNVLSELVSVAARTLAGFDVEIVEKHHRMKADSPSGTALMLYETVRKERGQQAQAQYGRHGRMQKRTEAEIGIHAVRGGTVTGEHEVGFYGNGEQLILTHRAESRELFAQGALKAAAYLMNKPAGLYSMHDVVMEILSHR